MNIEIINVGTELLLGEIVNTNATDILKMCKELGFNVYYQSVVGDNPKRLYDMLDLAFKKGANCVITTGGLGPTADDLTKELSAKYLGLEMEYNEAEAKKVYDKCAFVMNQKVIGQSNYKQAYFPKDCIIIDNKIGTANGCIMQKDDKMIVNLPGPPKELRWTLKHVLYPFFEKYRKESIYTIDIDTMGVGESNMADILKDLIDNQNDVTIALYAGEDYNRVRLAYKAYQKEDALKAMEPLKQEITSRLNKYLVDHQRIYQTVFKTIPPFDLYYLSDFEIEEEFLNQPLLKEKILSIHHIHNPKEIHSSSYLSIQSFKKELGDTVEICYDDGNKKHTYSLNFLYDASLSMKRFEGRLVLKLYEWLVLNKEES